MGVLNDLNVITSKDSSTERIFENIYPNFLDVSYIKPSQYVIKYWEKYKSFNIDNRNTNGKIFEHILSTLLIRENLLPLFLGAKVAFVPNVIYDILLYTNERGPICLSAKTSLRERYKQADLEAIALKYVHRKSLSYLITLDEEESIRLKAKIKSGDVIGLDKVIFAFDNEFDQLITDLKSFTFSESPIVKVIECNHIVTKESLDKVVKTP